MYKKMDKYTIKTPFCRKKGDSYMTITTEVINENKDKIKIHITPDTDWISINISYRIKIEVIPYRKRKSIFPLLNLTDDYNYRYADKNDRANMIKSEIFKYITKEQLQEAVNNAYKQLVPTEENIIYMTT